jgi:DNA (cytosine-5)-methyltransferase 1
MIGVDLFSGAGGMSLGASAAGIKIAFAVEADTHAAATYAHNHRNTFLLQDDIRKVSWDKVRETWGCRRDTVVFGGPPCQGFSYSNQKTRSRENPSNWLFREFMRAVRELKPTWVVFENVKGITDTEGGIFFEQVLDELNGEGYTLTDGILDAADFGVPQHRQRLFIVGSREGVKLALPEGDSAHRFTVRDAIDDLPRLVNGALVNWLPYHRGAKSAYARRLRRKLARCPNHLVSCNAQSILNRYRYIPQGGNWEDIPSRLMRNYADRSRCHTGIYHRLHGHRPSIVIGNYRKNMLIHPKADRGLSVREAARIQSFPDWFEFVGSIGFQQQQVGNAVPPLLAAAVFKEIMRAEDHE